MNSPAVNFFEAPQQPSTPSSIDALSRSIGLLSINGYVEGNPSLPFLGTYPRTHQVNGVIPQRTPVPTAWFGDSMEAAQNPFLEQRIFPEPYNYGGRFVNGSIDPWMPQQQDGGAGLENYGVHQFSNLGFPKDDSFLSNAKTQQGSMEIQKSLNSNDDMKLMMTYMKAVPFTVPLMMDQHGCHVFMKLLDFCSDTQLRFILAEIIQNIALFLEISSCRSGSKSLKRLIKRLQKSPMLAVLINILANEFYPLMVHPIGSHVVLECIDTLQPQQNELLYLKAIEHCLELATNEFGCIALNIFINHSKGPYRYKLLNSISNHVVYLSQDPSGNYVVQNVLALENPCCSREICSQLKGHYARLSMQKGGSHVVEKCLSSREMMKHVVEDLLNTNQLIQVARDKFGNYVVQKALQVTKRAESSQLHQQLVSVLKQHKYALQYGYGKNVWHAIENEKNAAVDHSE
ncbi:unnamed protein product [Linum tenue]|uniref:PUM-HD domain-containing protein n=1 Tax=Linum tenue TaxID=586396 RepID=A0AAV0GPD1_9ROSI|nr:unnamed protein product [Linum tenue]